jgi:hypothetical protein
MKKGIMLFKAGKLACQLILFVFAFVLLAAGCGRKEKTAPASGNITDSAKVSGTESGDVSKAAEAETKGDAYGGTKEGFQFEYNSTVIPMNTDAAPVIDKLGEPAQYFEAASCAFNGLDKTYTYSGFELTTYPSEDKDYISTVYFLDDSVATDKGIFIGSTLEDVTAAYGEKYTEKSGEYTYTLGDTKLSFLIKDDSVTSITYSAVVEGLNN